MKTVQTQMEPCEELLTPKTNVKVSFSEMVAAKIYSENTPLWRISLTEAPLKRKLDQPGAHLDKITLDD